MQQKIVKYPVKHPLLQKYIKFFWEIHADHLQLEHKIIPVRNIDLKFNLSDTPHYLCLNGEQHALESVYFSGLQDHFRNARLRLDGRVDVLGICFMPDGPYPFMKIPVSEFKNRLLGANEIGFHPAKAISDKLREAPNIAARLEILERELVRLLDEATHVPESFRHIFNAIKNSDTPQQLSEFCQRHHIGMRTLQRLYNKYVGVSPKTYATIYRFQNCVNQLTNNDYAILSDIAYGNGYYDQMHFIRTFKNFTGDTPKSFVQQKKSMLQVGKLT